MNKNPDGSAIELEDRDIHISVHGLITAVLPAMLPAARHSSDLCKPRRQSDLGREVE